MAFYSNVVELILAFLINPRICGLFLSRSGKLEQLAFSPPPKEYLPAVDITNPITLRYLPDQNVFRQYIKIWIGGDPRIAGGPGYNLCVYTIDRNGNRSEFNFNKHFMSFKTKDTNAAKGIIDFYCYIYNRSPISAEESNTLGLHLKDNATIQFFSVYKGFEAVIYLKEERYGRLGYFITKFNFSKLIGCQLIDDKCIENFYRYE